MNERHPKIIQKNTFSEPLKGKKEISQQIVVCQSSIKMTHKRTTIKTITNFPAVDSKLLVTKCNPSIYLI